MAPGDKLGEKLLDGPYLKAKLEKLYAPHLHTEALMDRWNKEAQAKQKSKKKPKEETHGKTKRRARDRKGRTGSNRKKDKPLAEGGEAAGSGGGDESEHATAGSVDKGR